MNALQNKQTQTFQDGNDTVIREVRTEQQQVDGEHIVATGTGAAAGTVAGAAIGTAIAGPAGTLVGSVIGGALGAKLGHDAGENIAPNIEETEIVTERRLSPNQIPGGTYSYNEYRPAIRYGEESRRLYKDGRTFDDYEVELRNGWERSKDAAGMAWADVREAVRDGWDRITGNFDPVVDNSFINRYPRSSYLTDAERLYSTATYAGLAGSTYADYLPAYDLAYESYPRLRGRSFVDAENSLRDEWERGKFAGKRAWADVRDAVRDGWNQIEASIPGDFGGDGI